MSVITGPEVQLKTFLLAYNLKIVGHIISNR